MSKYLNDNRLLFLQKKVIVKYLEKTDNGMLIDASQYHYEYIISKR